jgi:nucleoside-diphosphate-sugar epimerase
VIHQLTDLSTRDTAANARLRILGTRNLVDACEQAGVSVMVAQSISWAYAPGSEPAVERTPLDVEAPEPRATTVAGILALESAIARLPQWVCLRYGPLYGEGTWYAPDRALAEAARAGSLTATSAWTCFVHVDDAALAAVQALEWPSGPINIVDDAPAREIEWMPIFARRVGARDPRLEPSVDGGRPVSNAAVRALGWIARHPSWRAELGR